MTGDKLSISACLIVKDEEAFIKECLVSISGIVDEIIIGDTGSSDQTVKIARDYGARILHVNWENDFSAARNAVIRKARSPWILSIDADERLHGFDKNQFEQIVGDNSIYAVKSLLRPQRGWTDMNVVRLFRNDSRIFFRNIIHETVMPSVIGCIDESGGGVINLPFVLHHLGYEGEMRTKHDRSLPLLLRQLTLTPDSTYHLHHLGLIFQYRNEMQAAVDTWNRGIEATRKKQSLSVLDACPYIDLIQHYQNQNIPAKDLLGEALALFPDHPDLLWLNSHALFMERDYLETIRYLDILIAIGEDKSYHRDISYHEKIFTEFAFDLMGMCYLNMKNFKTSAHWFGKAYYCNPENWEYLMKKNMAISQENN